MILKFSNNRGSVLLTAMYVTTILITMGTAFVIMSVNEASSALKAKKVTEALNVAEAGVERAIYDLRRDCSLSPLTFSWADGSINGMGLGPDNASYYDVVGYNGNSMNSGSYSVQLKNVAGQNQSIWIHSTGSVGSVSQTIVAYIHGYVLSPWHTVIFGGSGQSSTVINGNFNAYGSVHLLGDSLTSSDYAMELTGAHAVGNNYQSLSSGLNNLIAPLTNVTFNNDSVQSLGAKLWVKKGLVGLSGSSSVGESNVSANAFKETVDGVFVGDGFSGTLGSSAVHADNGTDLGYILGNSISYPSLATPYLIYGSYAQYLKDNALVISDAATLDQLNNILPSTVISLSDSNGKGSLTLDGGGNLVVSGIIYIDGGNFHLNKSGSDKTITYSGQGVIYVSGDININVNLKTEGSHSFPTNIVTFLTPGEIVFNEPNIDVLGLFYTESQILVKQSMTLLGTFVTPYLDISADSSFYQVPDTVNHLPTGTIAGSPVCYMDIVSWKKEL